MHAGCALRYELPGAAFGPLAEGRTVYDTFSFMPLVMVLVAGAGLLPRSSARQQVDRAIAAVLLALLTGVLLLLS